MPYIKQCFDVVTFEQAKHVVLSSEPDKPEKFQQETQYLIDVIKSQNIINSESVVLDFGCGMGRVSKELINTFECKVFGVDISPSMLMFARIYTAKPYLFTTTDSYNEPESIDVALSILCLQHVENPQKEIDNIIGSLKPNGVFVLLNEQKRWIPTGIKKGYIDWSDDGFDVVGYANTNLKKFYSVQYMKTSMEIIFYRKEQ